MDKEKRLFVLLLIVSTISPLVLMLTRMGSLTSGYSIWIGFLMIAIFVPIIALGVYMAFTGKGQSLISGYNMMSKENRACFDGRALAKATGWVLLIICIPVLIGMVAIFFFDDLLTLLFSTALAIILAVVLLVYMNTGGRYLKDPTVRPKSSLSKRGKIVICVVVAAIAVVSIVGIYALTQSGSVDAELGDDELHVSAPMLDENISYDDIGYVELKQNLDLGYRASGFAGSHVLSGLFHNDLYGDYHLGAYKSVDLYIVVHYNNEVLVFNQDSVADTTSFYEDLLIKLAV